MIGSFGLDKDVWQTIFYDDDLPEDWRASYYSTLLRSVYLPPEEWRQSTENNLVDEVDEDFRLVLQARTTEDIKLLTELKEDFSALVAGVVLEYKPGDEAKGQGNKIAELQKHFPVCLDAGPLDYADTGIDKICEEHQVCAVWTPSIQANVLPSGDFLVVLISDETLPEQKKIVTEIEKWMNGQRRAGLFNTSVKDAPVRAEETRVLAELMGV